MARFQGKRDYVRLLQQVLADEGALSTPTDVTPGAHFTDDISIAIQIQRGFGFAVIPLLVVISLQTYMCKIL